MKNGIYDIDPIKNLLCRNSISIFHEKSNPMKNICRILFVLSCLFTNMNPLKSQWMQTNGPYGGSVSCFAVSGTNLFAGSGISTVTGSGSNSGIFLSTNNGASWTAVNTGLTNTNVQALAVSGVNLFAGTYGGVFLSTDNGASWDSVNTGLKNTQVLSLAVIHTNLFSGTSCGVFLSTNNGTSWTAVNFLNAHSSLQYPSLPILMRQKQVS